MAVEGSPGLRLIAAAGRARTRALLAAPFIKVAVLEAVLGAVPDDIEIVVVTRWRPEEVAAGVSDLECWEVTRARPRSQFLLHPALHAKYYRFDDRVLIGSANLTEKGLGLVRPANLEILEDGAVISNFEHELLNGARPPTESLYQEVKAAAGVIASESNRIRDPSVEAVQTGAEPDNTMWIPQTRHPDDLYLAYSGDGECLSSRAFTSAAADLSVLDLPGGLSQDAFRLAVRAVLLSLPIVEDIDGYLAEARRFGEVRSFLIDSYGFDRDTATHIWQVFMRWLVHFFPERYERMRPGHTESLRKRMRSV